MTRFFFNEMTRYPLYHHAVQIDEGKYYNVFIVGEKRRTVITEGSQEKAMKSAFNKCLIWLESFIDTNATFSVVSNAAEIATIASGNITVIDADLLREIDKKVRLEELEAIEQEKKAQREERKAKREAEKIGAQT
jgi:hypothetical protein